MSIQTIGDMTSFKWATVTSVSPLAIRLDGDTDALTLVPDSLVDPKTLWVGVRVRVELTQRKVIIHGVSAGTSTVVPGEIKIYAAASAPAGWLLCQGQSLLRADYPSLFATIGTTYGAADSTHFSLPDLRGRVAIGSGTATGAAGATAHPLGQVGGEEKHVLGYSELPEMKGTRITWGQGNINFSGNPQAAQGAPGGNGLGTWQNDPKYDADAAAWSPKGSGHNTMQPFVTLNYIIKI